MDADLLISMVLNEGRKIPLRPRVGGRRVPKFGRKARRFGSKAPILDKGGELSVVDRFGFSIQGTRPNVQHTIKDTITHFGPPSRSKEVNDRHESLVHLFHHLNRYHEMGSGENISSDEYNEMMHHKDRLIHAEAIRVVDGLHRMLRKSGSYGDENDPTHINPNVKLPNIEDKSDFEKIYKKDTYDFPDERRTRVHDVGEHGFLGVLPTRKGEMMTGIFRRMKSRYLDSEEGNFKIDKEKAIADTRAKLHALYNTAREEDALPVREHDHRKVIEFARKLKGVGPRMPSASVEVEEL